MKIKPPSEFEIKDWVPYLKGAILRETGKEWKPMYGTWTKKFKDLTEEGEYNSIDPFLLALAVDVIALNWSSMKVVAPWEVLSPGRLFYQFSGLGYVRISHQPIMSHLVSLQELF